MINAYMVDDIIILTKEAVDSWGDPTSGEIISLKGYVVWGTKLIRNLAGEEVVMTCMVYLHKDQTEDALGRALSHEDRIFIEGEDHDRSILRIDQPKAFSGPHYLVYLS